MRGLPEIVALNNRAEADFANPPTPSRLPDYRGLPFVLAAYGAWGLAFFDPDRNGLASRGWHGREDQVDGFASRDGAERWLASNPPESLGLPTNTRLFVVHRESASAVRQNARVPAAEECVGCVA